MEWSYDRYGTPPCVPQSISMALIVRDVALSHVPVLRELW